LDYYLAPPATIIHFPLTLNARIGKAADQHRVRDLQAVAQQPEKSAAVTAYAPANSPPKVLMR